MSGWLHYRYGLHPPNNIMSSTFDHTATNTFTDTMKKINAILDDSNGHTTAANNDGHTSPPQLATVPGMYRFQFKLDHVADTYLKLNQWEKVIHFNFF